MKNRGLQGAWDHGKETLLIYVKRVKDFEASGGEVSKENEIKLQEIQEMTFNLETANRLKNCIEVLDSLKMSGQAWELEKNKKCLGLDLELCLNSVKPECKACVSAKLVDK
jgi:hypothetical protein